MKHLIHVSWLIFVFYVISMHAQYQGYGAGTPGGKNGDIYRVTSLEDSGPGTLRDAVHQTNGTNRYVVFDTAGTITLQTDIVIRGHHLTIDGSTAPAPGITIKKTTIHDGEFLIAGTHDIIMSHLRFQGLWKNGGTHSNNAATISIDGDSGPDRIARNIVLDHITASNATDGGPDIWGEVSDITVSYCFFYYNWHPTTVSHYPSPFQTRQRISMHHNVYAKNGERNPQIRADVRDFNYINNVVYDWGYFGEGGGYGIRIKNGAGEPKVNGNFINNFFVPTIRPSWALVYGINPGRDGDDSGPDAVIPQDSVFTGSALGDLYVRGNYFPPENQDHYSTISSPLTVPDSAQVTTHDLCMLSTLLNDSAGMKYRSQAEQDMFDGLKAAMDSIISPCPITSESSRDNRAVPDIRVFPNPNNMQLTICLHQKIKSDITIMLFDMLGKKIHQESVRDYSGEFRHKIDLSGKAKGLYVLKVKLKDRIYHKRLIHL
jgi:pectate lyase